MPLVAQEAVDVLETVASHQPRHVSEASRLQNPRNDAGSVFSHFESVEVDIPEQPAKPSRRAHHRNVAQLGSVGAALALEGLPPLVSAACSRLERNDAVLALEGKRIAHAQREEWVAVVLPQHVGENAAVVVVLELHRDIDLPRKRRWRA